MNPPEFAPADIKKVLIDEDDFGHEMRVGKVFSDIYSFNTGIGNQPKIEQPDHGGTYTDPVTSKPRQFDYRCVMSIDSPGGHERRCLMLAVECKNLSSFSPLVVAGRDRTEDESHYDFIESEAEFLGPLMRRGTAKHVHSDKTLYPAGEFVGKSLSRMVSKPKGLEIDRQPDMYDRWSQALASSEELAERAFHFAMRNSTTPRKTSSLILPFVVVPDGRLWRAQYDERGNIYPDPERVDECEFYVGKTIEQRVKIFTPVTISHIHFVTLTGFRTFLERYIKDTAIWAATFPGA